MADASTAQLVTVAVISAVGGGGLATFTKWAEFKREDRSRWMTERRQAYAALIDHLTDMEQAAGAAALVARSLQDAGPDVLADEVQNKCAQAFEAFRKAEPEIAVLRLLAPAAVVRDLDEVKRTAARVMHQTVLGELRHQLDVERLNDTRAALNAALTAFTAAARADIRA